MPRRVFVTSSPYPADDATITQAEAVGATEIVHGLSGQFPAEGLVIVPDPPESSPPTNPAADQLEAAAQSAAAAALDDVRALAPLLQAAADALRNQ